MLMLASSAKVLGMAAWSPRQLGPRVQLERALHNPVIRCRLTMSVEDLDGPPLLCEARSFFAEHDVRLRCVDSAPPGSRTTSRVAVRVGQDGRGAVIGMFKPGTHDVIPCAADERCHVPHHPALNEAIAAVSSTFEALGELSAYDETTGSGTLRYLQLSVERSTRRVQCVLVANVRKLEEDAALVRFAAHLWAAHGDTGTVTATAAVPRSVLRLHSIWANMNPTATNNILSYTPHAWQLLHQAPAPGGGDSFLDGALLERYTSGSAFVLPPFVFRQANLDGFDAIVAELRAALPARARVVEWYAGVGSLGLSIAPACDWVRCSDVNPPHAAFEASRALLPPEVRRRVTYAVGDAADRIGDAAGANVAVVDPPRKGLAPPLLTALCAPRSCDGGSAERLAASAAQSCAGLRTLVYISCGFPALRSDLNALLAAGWVVRGGEASAHVLFTGANHIETVVVLDRPEGTGTARPAHGSAFSDGPITEAAETPAETPAESLGGAGSARAASSGESAGAVADLSRSNSTDRRPRVGAGANLTPRARRLAARKRRNKT